VATLASDLVATTKRHLYSGARDERDVLNGTINSSVTSLTTTNATTGIQVGVVIEIDLEQMYVTSVSGTTVGVLRGQEGTTAAAHTTGALIWVNPRFPTFNIFQELNNELAALSSPTSGLYKIGTLNLTWTGATVGYNLTSVTDILDVLDVAYEDYSYTNWVDVPPGAYQLMRNMDTGEFASGSALIFKSSVVVPGRTVRVRYKAPFTALAALADDVQTVSGLPATANDIPPLGAAARLAGPGEVRRTFLDGQSDPRADGDVPAGARLNAASWLLARRERRVGEEAARLARRFPVTRARY
jgi:hypothetical protein